MVVQRDGSAFRPSDLPPGRVAVMFTADWCGYCHRFLPHYKALREQWVVDISDDDDPLWDALAIRVVPTVIVFRDGVPAQRWAGVLGPGVVPQIQAALSADPASSASTP
ncbi:MAG TPA: thioredoxin family protein [Candidatus Thermoplasmatota archaeon]|nr:thioredoxin family protein [Candidatus Thermoplasmatota archaeon]